MIIIWLVYLLFGVVGTLLDIFYTAKKYGYLNVGDVVLSLISIPLGILGFFVVVNEHHLFNNLSKITLWERKKDK